MIFTLIIIRSSSRDPAKTIRSLDFMGYILLVHGLKLTELCWGVDWELEKEWSIGFENKLCVDKSTFHFFNGRIFHSGRFCERNLRARPDAYNLLKVTCLPPGE